jgi:hypothetical protein
VIESGRPLLIPEERITDASGSVRWLQTVKCPIIGDSGRAEQVLGVSTDITDRKRIEVEHIVASEGASVVGAQAGAVGIMAADRRSFELLAMTGVSEATFREWRVLRIMRRDFRRWPRRYRRTRRSRHSRCCR